MSLPEEMPMTHVYNRTSEKQSRRALRKDMPRAEVLLWSKLRDRQLSGLKLRRQYSVGPYVIDYYCPAARLAVEVDGDSHFGKEAERRDARRQAYVESFGIRFVRCTNLDVYENIEGVLQEIERVGAQRVRSKDPP